MWDVTYDCVDYLYDIPELMYSIQGHHVCLNLSGKTGFKNY